MFKNFDESGTGKPKPTRMTAAEEEKMKEDEINNICAKEEEEEKMAMEALDLVEDKDALAKFDGAWSAEALGSKKWTDKKQKMEELNAEINAPKILPNGNKANVMEVLAKFVTDSNMNVYDEVVKAIGFLAVGLKKDFAEEAKTIAGKMLSKLKKKPSIIQNVKDTCEKLLNSVTVEELIPVLAGALADRSPLIVKTTMEFYQVLINQTYIDDLKKIYLDIVPTFVKLGSHQDGSVRELSLKTIGLFKGRLASDIEKFLGDFNQQKLEKITEAAGEYQLTKFDKPRVQKKKKKAPPKEEKKDELMDMDMDMGGPPKPKKKKKKKAGGPPAGFLQRQAKMQEKAQTKFETMKAELKGEAPPASKPDPNEEEKVAPSETAASSAPVEKKEKILVEDTGSGVAKEDATMIVEERVPPAIVKQFDESKWQDKKEAYSKLADWLNQQEYSSETLEASIWFMRIKMNDWKEKNMNIIKG